LSCKKICQNYQLASLLTIVVSLLHRTSAARPTYFPAIGSENSGFLASAPSRAISGKDMPGHTTLKYRSTGQNSQSELQNRDLKEELEERERKHNAKRERDPKLIKDEDEPDGMS